MSDRRRAELRVTIAKKGSLGQGRLELRGYDIKQIRKSTKVLDHLRVLSTFPSCRAEGKKLVGRESRANGTTCQSEGYRVRGAGCWLKTI
jgi:hypothetical protein